MTNSDKIKLKSVLEYCLVNLKHPETPVGSIYGLNLTTDGYYPPPIPTYDSLINDANATYEKMKARAEKIKQYEDCLVNIQLLLLDLNYIVE